jgi:ketosteroid isomerase-like protein
MATIFTTAQDAENAFYEALARGDLDLMMAVWADEEEIVCVHPGAQRLVGQEQVRDSWRKILSGGAGLGVHVTQQVALSGAMVAVHSVQENLTPPGEKKPSGPVVATNVYLRSGAGWRMVAHHASPAPGQAEVAVQAPVTAGPKTLH